MADPRLLLYPIAVKLYSETERKASVDIVDRRNTKKENVHAKRECEYECKPEVEGRIWL